MAIVNLTYQQQTKPISPNWANTVKTTGGVTNFEQLANEVQAKELKNLLGIEFYTDMIANISESKYTDLLNGKTFESCCGYDVSFSGIKYMLAFMNYSKYVGISDNADTMTGFVRQNRTETTPLSEGAIKREQMDAREIALQDFEVMKEYLDLNPTIYPIWNRKKSKKVYLPKFTGLKRTLT